VFLSNDDSMSLASAQRLLWAVQSGGRATADQIRPHELLNYFGFDTVAPAPGEVFGVSGSAARTADDTLTLAFAVEGVTPERQPLDLTVVLDRSGSMSAEGRMEYLKRGLRQLAGNLQRGDRVNLVLFDHEACNPLEGYVHGRDDARLLTGVVDALAPRGSTDLDLGVREGYRLARAQGVKGRNGRVLLISDALLNTGDVNPATVSEVARAYENDGVRLSAVGVGRDFNDKVLDMLTEKGKGAYVYLGSEAVVDRIFGAGFDSLVQTVAHDVHFSVDLPESLAMTRFYGEEASTVKADVQPIHYYAGTRQLFLQDVALRDGDVVRGDTVTFHVEYTDALTGRKAERSWSSTVGELLVADDHNLRKGRALMGWTDLQLARAMGGDACGAPFSTWQERAAVVQGDAELAWLDGITARQCGGRTVSSYTPARRGVDFKVRVDSDIPIAEVAMSCAAVDQRAALTGGGNVARFANVAPGSCTVTLGGVVPMVAQVEVPVVGGQATCRVRGGRLGCS
jgi:Ca-activated chloride channel family protein